MRRPRKMFTVARSEAAYTMQKKNGMENTFNRPSRDRRRSMPKIAQP